MAAAADALGLLRLAAAVALPDALGRAQHGGGFRWLPLALAGVAATTDFVDGRLARRAGQATRHGAALDNAADIAFVLAGTGAGAALGLVPWTAPAAIALAFGAYAVSSLGRSVRAGGWRLARSRIGRTAGVCNYGLVVLIAASLARPHPLWGGALVLASRGVVAINVAAVLARVVLR